MKTGDDYRASLADDRRVIFQGSRVDVATHPAMAHAVDAAAATYDRFHDASPQAINPLFEVPRSVDALRDLIEIVRRSDVLGSVTYQSLFAALTASPAGPKRWKSTVPWLFRQTTTKRPSGSIAMSGSTP